MQRIIKLTKSLNSATIDWSEICLSPFVSKNLTELFCRFPENKNGFIALEKGIAYHVFRAEKKWDWDVIGQPNVLLNIKDAVILPELERQCAAINWVVVEGDVTGVSTPFMTRFANRINAIIDTTYVNLKIPLPTSVSMALKGLNQPNIENKP